MTKKFAPFFFEEPEFRGLDKNFGWQFPKIKEPLCWAEGLRCFYRGELVGLQTFAPREKIAACIKAEPQEILFTSGDTESNKRAIKFPVLANLRERPNIIVSAVEHKAILNSCAAMENLDCTVTKLPVDKFGLANNEVGTIPLDVKFLGADMLSASAHKFNGPKGSGFLYVCEGLKLLPYIDGGGQELSKRVRNCKKILLDHLNGNNINFILNGGENRYPFI